MLATKLAAVGKVAQRLGHSILVAHELRARAFVCNPVHAITYNVKKGDIKMGSAVSRRISTIQQRAQSTPSQSQAQPVKAEVRQFSKPTIQMAKDMPRAYSEMSNEALLIYTAQSDFGANRERMIREIMYKDNISWDEAQPKLREMERANKELMSFFTLPYKIGIFSSTVAGVASIPLCFHLDTVIWFNEKFVTADMAEPKDLETWLEVGAWSWSWMEPPLGQLSFFLLCFAFARNQMINLGVKPYTNWLKDFRADRLYNKYPMYDREIVRDFAVNDSWR